MTNRKNPKPEKSVSELSATYAEVLELWARKLTENDRVYVVCHDEVTEANTLSFVKKEKIIFYGTNAVPPATCKTENEINNWYETNEQRIAALFLDAIATRNVLYAPKVTEMYSSKGFRLVNSNYESEMMSVYKEIAQDVWKEYEKSASFQHLRNRKAGYVDEQEFLTSDEFAEQRTLWGDNYQTITSDFHTGRKTVPKKLVRVGMLSVEEIEQRSFDFESVVRDVIYDKVSKKTGIKSLEKLYQVNNNTYIQAFIDIGYGLRKAIDDESNRLKTNNLRNIRDGLNGVRVALEGRIHDKRLKKENHIIHGDFSMDLADTLKINMHEAKKQGYDMVDYNNKANMASANGKLIEFTVNLINTLHADDGADEFEKRLSSSSGPTPFGSAPKAP